MGLGGGSKQKDLKEDKSSSSVPQTFAHLDLQVRTNKSNVTLHKFKTWENQAFVILILVGDLPLVLLYGLIPPQWKPINVVPLMKLTGPGLHPGVTISMSTPTVAVKSRMQSLVTGNPPLIHRSNSSTGSGLSYKSLRNWNLLTFDKTFSDRGF